METVVSGIRPTGNLHLGNYFGAVKSFLRMQDEYNCFFFIADWHSLTTHPHPDNIRNSVKDDPLGISGFVVSIRKKLPFIFRAMCRRW